MNKTKAITALTIPATAAAWPRVVPLPSRAMVRFWHQCQAHDNPIGPLSEPQLGLRRSPIRGASDFEGASTSESGKTIESKRALIVGAAVVVLLGLLASSLAVKLAKIPGDQVVEYNAGNDTFTTRVIVLDREGAPLHESSAILDVDTLQIQSRVQRNSEDTTSRDWKNSEPDSSAP